MSPGVPELMLLGEAAACACLRLFGGGLDSSNALTRVPCAWSSRCDMLGIRACFVKSSAISLLVSGLSTGSLVGPSLFVAVGLSVCAMARQILSAYDAEGR